jgi:hypothetical protein
MSAIKIVAVLLIVAGILGLVYGQLTYVEDSHDAKLGPLEFSFKEKETVRIPTWVSIGAVAAGTLMLLFGKRR